MTTKKECQECGADISIPDDAVVGEIVTCPDCGGDYEIATKAADKVELKAGGNSWRRLGTVIGRDLRNLRQGAL
ncbi:lysine biosynthesis protein LysW [Candidatus Nitrososphaera sp. FF02]|uniref:lysine biosynthesis protein LysW n=1 Tax=Candidatus Nitrososphaera sp. FF02 TaxID=3398226 RepID=UPI0039E85EFE